MGERRLLLRKKSLDEMAIASADGISIHRGDCQMKGM